MEMRWPISVVLSDECVTKKADRYLDLKNEQWDLARRKGICFWHTSNFTWHR